MCALSNAFTVEYTSEHTRRESSIDSGRSHTRGCTQEVVHRKYLFSLSVTNHHLPTEQRYSKVVVGQGPGIYPLLDAVFYTTSGVSDRHPECT